jgi:hypothetical protein
MDSFEVIMPTPVPIQNYVNERRITAEQARKLNKTQLRNLESNEIHEMIVAGTLTFEQALGLNEDEFQNLNSPAIHSLIDKNGAVTLWQVLGLFMSQLWNPQSTGFIADTTLTLEQAMGLTSYQRENLEPEAIRGLIADGILTIGHALELNAKSIILNSAVES